jgi:hypothetical protein
MAIAFTAGDLASGSLVNPVNPSWTQNVTGPNTILWVAARLSTADTITLTATKGAADVAMTQIDTTNIWGTNYEFLFMLAGVDTGTVTIKTTIGGAGAPNLQYGSISYSGAAQSGQPDAHATDSQATNPTDVPLTTVGNNSWIVLACNDDNDNTLTASTNATERAAPSTNFKLFDTNGAQTPAGAKTMTISHVNTNTLKSLIASFSPASAAAARVPYQPYYQAIVTQ